MITKKIFLYSICLFVGFSSLAAAQDSDPLKYGSQYEGKRQDEAMQKFRENRLGQFIHWGLYAIPGGEWNGKIYPGAAEWLKAWADVPMEEWSKLIRSEEHTSELQSRFDIVC